MPVSPDAFLLQKAAEKWTGTITLNLKEGVIISFEVAEKHRVSKD